MYIWPKLRTVRPRKIKIGTEVAHVTRDSDTTFKVKRSRSPGWGRFTHRGVYTSGSCSGDRGESLPWEPTATLSSAGAAARGASAPTEGGEGPGISWRSPAYSLFFYCNVLEVHIRSRWVFRQHTVSGFLGGYTLGGGGLNSRARVSQLMVGGLRCGLTACNSSQKVKR